VKAQGKVTEHKQDDGPSYYTDSRGRICSKGGTPFRDRDGERHVRAGQ
jgi:hypothetical protein